MRFRNTMKTIDIMTREELMGLFDRAAWTLGFSSASTRQTTLLDAEAAVVLVAYLAGLQALRLGRFLPVLLNWLRTRHHLLHPAKLLKMARAAEVALGEQAPLRLALHTLRASDPKRFQSFRPPPLSVPFYPEPRLATLVDQKIEKEGYYLDLTAEDGFHIPKSAFVPRPSDLLSEKALLTRNEQLRNRLLHGPTWRADAVLLLRDHPWISASELADMLMLSYEPAHRLVREIARYRSLGFQMANARSSDEVH